MYKILIFLLLLTAFPGHASAQDSGTVAVTTVLRKTPDYTATVVQTLARDTALEVLKRDGSWFQVEVPGKGGAQGWVRMFDVRLQAGHKAGQGGGLGGLFSFFRRDDSNPRTGVTSTIGIRGLGASDLKTARPNRRELAKLDHYRSSEARAIGFSMQGHLPERKIDYFKTLPGGGAASGQLR